MPLYRNPLKRPVTITLVHEDAPRTSVQIDAPMQDPKSGEIAVRQIERRVPESVTVLGGETRELPAFAKKHALAAGLVAADPPPEQKPAQPEESQPQAAAPEASAEASGDEQAREPLQNALKRKKGA